MLGKVIVGGGLFLCLFAVVLLLASPTCSPVVLGHPLSTQSPATASPPSLAHATKVDCDSPPATQPTAIVVTTERRLEETYFAEYQDMLTAHIDIEVVTSVPANYTGTVIFYQSVPVGLSLSGVSPFLINTEQNTVKGKHYPTVLRSLAEYPNLRLVDYSVANLAILLSDPAASAGGFKRRSRLLALFPSSDYVRSNAEPRKVDFAFVGTQTARRAAKLKECRDMGFSFSDIKEWGKGKVPLLSEARVLINIHVLPDYKIFESLRMMVALAAGTVVLSEPSLAPSSTSLESLVVTSEYSLLCQTLKVILDSYPNYQQRWARVNWTAVQVAARTQVRDVFFGDWVHPIAMDELSFFTQVT